MGYVLWGLLFVLAGFVLESCVCVYHLARENNRIILSSIAGSVITCIGILVISRIVYGVVNTSVGHLYLAYVLTFAFGKGLGTYTSLTLWDRYHPKKHLQCCKDEHKCGI